MKNWLVDHLEPVVVVLAVVFVVVLVWGTVADHTYYVTHHCHGDGHYYWTTQCISTGKSVTCYPVQYEGTVCDQ